MKDVTESMMVICQSVAPNDAENLLNNKPLQQKDLFSLESIATVRDRVLSTFVNIFSMTSLIMCFPSLSPVPMAIMRLF
jgi:hypothetical protein